MQKYPLDYLKNGQKDNFSSCSSIKSIVTEAKLIVLGAYLATMLTKGECVALSGEIGAGKTTLARAIIGTSLAQMGLQEEIPSPTFTLVQVYPFQKTELWHFDLYRLTSPQEAYELGLLEALTQAICLIEWSERLGSEAPPYTIHIAFEHMSDPTLRRLRITSCEKYRAPLQNLLASSS